MENPEWQFNLSISKRILYHRKHGSRDRKEHDIREVSWFFKPHWKFIEICIDHDLVALDQDDVQEFRPRAKAICGALQFLAEHLGLECTVLKHPTKLLWLARSRPKGDGNDQDRTWKPFCEWRILNAIHMNRLSNKAAITAALIRRDHKHTSWGKRFLRLENDSQAIMRDTIIVFSDGWSLVPCKTRKGSE